MIANSCGVPVSPYGVHGSPAAVYNTDSVQPDGIQGRELTWVKRMSPNFFKKLHVAHLKTPTQTREATMNLVDRVKNILLQPKTEWAAIEPEQTDPKTLYTSYIVILALIPAVAALIGGPLAGGMGMGFNLGAAITQYVLSLVMVFVVAFIADALAPNFGGTKNLNQALKLTAYAMTAAWVAGVFVIVPFLGWLLALLGSLYSLYLFYLGVPVLMKVPEQKTVGYTVVVLVIAIVIGVVIGMISSGITGMGAAGPMGGMR